MRTSVRPWIFALTCWLAACRDPAGNGDGTLEATSGMPESSSSDSTAGDPLVFAQLSFVGITLAAQTDGFAWYRDVVGLEPHGGNWFGLGDGRSAVEVFAGGTASAVTKTPAQQSTVFGLQVPDLAASQAALEERGVVFEGPADGDAQESWIYLADPEGNRLELKQLGPAGPGLAVSRIAWVGIHVEDLAAMMAWYRDVLGLAQDGDTYFVLGDGGYVELFAGGTAADATKDATMQPVVVGLVVTDLDAALAELASRGVTMLEPIGEWEGPDWPDERWALVEDPERNRILIRQFTE